MPLFQQKNGQVKQISVDLGLFKDEAALRDFFAENLDQLLGLRFLAKEYSTRDGRIDTLALDETGGPVIIEYKWDEKDNILSQGLFYFDWLKENKRLFDLLVSDKLGKQFKVNWDRPRVILLAQGFDRYTLSAVRQVKYVELVKYTPYQAGVLYLENVYSPDTVKPVSETLKRKENEVYDLEYHLNGVNNEIKEVFYALQKEIKEWPNVEEKIDQKVGITYRTTKSFVRFEFGKSYIDVLVRDSLYVDPYKILDDITSFGWGFKGRIKLKKKEDIGAVLDLVDQSYQSTL